MATTIIQPPSGLWPTCRGAKLLNMGKEMAGRSDEGGEAGRRRTEKSPDDPGRDQRHRGRAGNDVQVDIGGRQDQAGGYRDEDGDDKAPVEEAYEPIPDDD